MEERASVLAGSEEDRIQVNRGDKADSGEESRWEGKQYIPHQRPVGKMRERV